MKKKGLVLLSALLFAPLLLLSGCSEPRYYSLTAMSSNEGLGSVSGGFSGKREEGSLINLRANLKPNSDSKFLCWIKDYTKIISTKSETDLTLSEQTQGHYTAVFEEASPSSMMFAGLSDISVSAANVDKITYEILYASTKSSGVYNTLTSGTKTGEDKVFNNDTFYFGNAGNLNNFRFKLTYSLTYTDNVNITTETIEFGEYISNDSFDIDGKVTISQATSQSYTVNLTFSKLTSLIFE